VVLKPAIREVVFLDTADFQLYNNAFILRQRIAHESGFPAGEPEIVFKFRHEDMQKAAALDVRPKFAGNYRIKFKAEAPPLRDQVGGYRLLFSHNAQFPLSQAPEGDRGSMGTLARVFPVLETLKGSETDRVELVNQTIVEEVLQDLGVLNFGKGSPPTRTSASGVSAALTTRCAASLRSRPNSSAGTTSTRRQSSIVSSSLSRCSSRVETGSSSARPRPGSSTGLKATRPRVMSDRALLRNRCATLWSCQQQVRPCPLL
jgi:hypothetical protein